MRLDIRPTAAPALTGLKTTPGIGAVTLEWAPCTDTTFSYTQIWTSTSSSFLSATLLATVQGNTYNYQAGDAATRNYWVRATNIYGRSDGPLTGPVSGTGKQVTTSDIAPGAVNLSTQVTGALSTGNITGLGALAVLDRLGIAKIDGLGSLASQNIVSSNQVSGLGALATQSTVNANTQITNLGSLAYANAIAANQIGAGTLAAGVVYAGTLNANQVNAGTFTGLTFQTAASGQRVSISAASNNIQVYDQAGNNTATFGGLSGNLSVSALNTVPGVSAFCSSGSTSGVYASATAGYGITTTFDGGTALNISGNVALNGSNGSIIQTNGSTNWLFSVVPSSDNTYTLGASGSRWTQIWAANATIQTSDRRTKTDITDGDLGLEFINALRPVKYKQLVAENVVTITQTAVTADNLTPEITKTITSRPGVRFHYGLISQEVKTVLDSFGLDASFWVLSNKDDPDSQQALRYEGFIGPLIKAVQQLSARLTTVETQLAANK